MDHHWHPPINPFLSAADVNLTETMDSIMHGCELECHCRLYREGWASLYFVACTQNAKAAELVKRVKELEQQREEYVNKIKLLEKQLEEAYAPGGVVEEQAKAIFERSVENIKITGLDE
jgi:hypothetical protein